MSDKGDVAVVQQRPDPVQHRVHASSHLLECLAGMGGVAANDAVPPQVPARPRLPDLRLGHALVAAVAPLRQLRIGLDAGQARQPAVRMAWLSGLLNAPTR